jgi:Na+/H+-translocating membrane pyrophosphatase
MNMQLCAVIHLPCHFCCAGVWVASALTLGLTAACCWTLFRSAIAVKLFGCVAIGLVAGVIIAKFTEYCTAYEFNPTRDISAASEYGPAPVIIKVRHHMAECLIVLVCVTSALMLHVRRL